MQLGLKYTHRSKWIAQGPKELLIVFTTAEPQPIVGAESIPCERKLAVLRPTQPYYTLDNIYLSPHFHVTVGQRLHLPTRLPHARQTALQCRHTEHILQRIQSAQTSKHPIRLGKSCHTLHSLKSLKIPRPFPPMIHRLLICVGRV
jgi:hypothetical protein